MRFFWNALPSRGQRRVRRHRTHWVVDLAGVGPLVAERGIAVHVMVMVSVHVYSGNRGLALCPVGQTVVKCVLFRKQTLSPMLETVARLVVHRIC